VAYIDTVKQWFLRKKKPTQSQFHTLFDYLRWKDEVIAMADINGLVSALISKVNRADYEGHKVTVDADYSYNIPAGYLLEKIICFWGSNANISMSLVAFGGADVLPITNYSSGWNNPIIIEEFAAEDKTIYINGIPIGSKIVFMKRKINYEDIPPPTGEFSNEFSNEFN
jgi:hypothetical protein